MNIDFDLGKDLQDRTVILRLKESLKSDWFVFQEQDSFLSFHTRLKLLASSKQEFKDKRRIRCKFVKKSVLGFYYDFVAKRFKFINVYLEPYQCSVSERPRAGPAADGNAVKSLKD